MAQPLSSIDPSMPVPPSSPPGSGRPPAASKVNHINRSIESISVKTENRYELLKIAHLTVAVATGVLFIAAVIASIVTTAIFSAPSIPFVSLGAFTLSFYVKDFFTARLAVAQSCGGNAKAVRTVREEFNATPTDEASLKQILFHLGIVPENIQSDEVKADLSKLRPLIAHYNYWHKFSETLSKEEANLRIKEHAHVQNHATEKEQIEELRVKVLIAQEGALAAKTNAAFYLGLMSDPNFSRESDELFQYGDTVEGGNNQVDLTLLGRRSLAAQFNDRHYEQFLTIRRPGEEPVILNRAQVQNMTEADIKKELFH